MNEYHNLPVGMNRVFLPGQIEIQEVSPEARLKNSTIIHPCPFLKISL